MKRNNEKVKQNQSRRFISLKWRLFACFGAFTAAVLLILWVFQVIFLEDFYKFIKTKETVRSASSVEEIITGNDLLSELQYISRKNEVCILITDLYGKTVASSDYLSGCIIHHVSDSTKLKLIEKALSSPKGITEHFDLADFGRDTSQNKRPGPSFKSESIIYVKTVKTEGYGDVVIFINAVISPVNATVQTLRIQIYIVTGILTLLGLLLAFLFARFIAKPISKLNDSARELAKGNYNADFLTAGGYGEISELGDSLEYAAKELSKLDSLKSELIANISHDLRTPLTLITGYSEVMRDIPDENTPENLQIIIDESKRLSSLVTDILDMSKFESGTVKLDVREFDLTQTVSDTIERFKRLIEKEGFEFEFIFDSHVMVRADELRISQVIYNLLNNAVIHAGGIKKVTVEQRVTEKYVTVGVIDYGKGIPEDKLKNIWERYYKVDKEHKRAQTGSGLGLSIVRSVISLHNEAEEGSAACGVKSEEGKGSTFWFALKFTRTDK